MEVYILKTREPYEGEVEIHGVFSSLEKCDEYMNYLRTTFPDSVYASENCTVLCYEYELDRGDLE